MPLSTISSRTSERRLGELQAIADAADSDRTRLFDWRLFSLRKVLTPAEWERLRAATLGAVCDCCGRAIRHSTPTLHEVWWFSVERVASPAMGPGRPPKPTGEQRLRDILTLCYPCRFAVRLHAGQMLDYIQQITGWTDDQLSAELAARTARSKARKRVNWRFNVDLLLDYGFTAERGSEIAARLGSPTSTED